MPRGHKPKKPADKAAIRERKKQRKRDKQAVARQQREEINQAVSGVISFVLEKMLIRESKPSMQKAPDAFSRSIGRYAAVGRSQILRRTRPSWVLKRMLPQEIDAVHAALAKGGKRAARGLVEDIIRKKLGWESR